jgi:hypothetical protein
MAFSRLRRAASAVAACLAAAGPLGGCGYEDQSRFAPVCPKVAVLADAADVTVYRPSPTPGGGHDLTDMVLDGRIEGLSGKCARASDTLLATHVTLSMQFSRGPAATTREMQVPYFIGVFEGDEILDKKVIPIPLVFPPNVDRLALDTQDVELDLPISSVKSGAVYTVRVGFQLTPDQLALNRKRGSRS